MAFDGSDLDSGAISTINVTPLVDVMLVLLIIFMVAAPIIQQGVELELPKETIAPLEGDGEQLIVSIDKKGGVFIGSGNPVDLKTLGPKLSAIVAQRQDKRVFVKADKAVPYGSVMAVMGAMRRNGITKIGLVTEPSNS
jgi:biopolymer transport protein TolR